MRKFIDIIGQQPDDLWLVKTKEILAYKLICDCGWTQHAAQLQIAPRKICPECGRNLFCYSLVCNEKDVNT